MSQVTRLFGGEPGQPYTAANTGVLIGKKPDQKGINAFQVITMPVVAPASMCHCVCVAIFWCVLIYFNSPGAYKLGPLLAIASETLRPLHNVIANTHAWQYPLHLCPQIEMFQVSTPLIWDFLECGSVMYAFALFSSIRPTFLLALCLLCLHRASPDWMRKNQSIQKMITFINPHRPHTNPWCSGERGADPSAHGRCRRHRPQPDLLIQQLRYPTTCTSCTYNALHPLANLCTNAW